MELDEYQKQMERYDLVPPDKEGVSTGMIEKILGLTGEAGEVADKIKKIVRDKNGEISDKDKDEIIKELGDVLWYTVTIARYLGVPISEVAKINADKLESRENRGKLHGSGDNR